MPTPTRNLTVAVLLALCTSFCVAQEAVIRQNLAARLPDFKHIDEVRKTAYPGVYEVRSNKTDIYYTNAQGSYLLQGNLVDTKSHKNLTQERLAKLTAITFDALPLKDAFTIVRGNGSRKLAIFEDPNCGYCKRFERDLQKVSDVTIYLFLYPILGPDSVRKSRTIWCSKEPSQTWLDLMLREQPVASTMAMCDSTAVDRNLELGRVHRIEGTPTLVFSNSVLAPGAMDSAKVEKLLGDAAAQ
jgi:thiol:disulfide interchange protein DsbC